MSTTEKPKPTRAGLPPREHFPPRYEQVQHLPSGGIAVELQGPWAWIGDRIRKWSA